MTFLISGLLAMLSAFLGQSRAPQTSSDAAGVEGQTPEEATAPAADQDAPPADSADQMSDAPDDPQDDTLGDHIDPDETPDTEADGAPNEHPTGDDAPMSDDETDPPQDHMGDDHGDQSGAPEDDLDSAPQEPDPHDHGGMPTGGADDDMMDDPHDHPHTPFPEPPGIDASSDEIASYLNALTALGETHVHDHGSELSGEHDAAMDLAPRSDASHVAIADGAWDDPAIWSTGTVPGDDASVLIPPGVTVTYGVQSDAELFTLRIDGKLEFETDTDSTMIFDTMLVAPGGHLEIGTVDNPVDPSVSIDLIVADNGPIDTDWDPMLLSRGLISHGRADIHGAVKDSHEKVIDDPMAGDTTLSFAETPEGWQVGDKIVIAGTRYEGHKWDNDIRAVRPHASEDEVRTITEIDGNTVHFDEALIFDHDTPRADLKTSVANYTRNVSIESENGAETQIFARGHVMFMHSDEVDVRYAEFLELGRTDKSQDSAATHNLDDIAFDSNIQGRYGLHLHRTGVEDLADPTILQGNAVFGSPGWGIVHHDSNAIIDNNATFDTFGAGYVAETGNETGAWTNNIAIYAEGQGWGNPKNFVNLDGEFDTARTGDGFWFQGRLVDSVDNIASSVNAGFSYFHRNGDNRMIDVLSDNFAFAGALDGETSRVDDVPIRAFSGNETFASNYGVHVVKSNPNQEHDVWSHLEDFTAWEVRTGAHLEYTSHYVLSDFDVIGKEATAFSYAQDGISLGNNTTEIVIVDTLIDGFPTGIDLTKLLTFQQQDPSIHDYFVINTAITGAETEFANYDPDHDTVLIDPTLVSQVPNLTLDGPLTYREGYPDPDARHVDISGTKTDALGTTAVPGGTDDFDISYGKVIEILEEDGYWTTPEGQAYFMLDLFFTDRLSGDVYVEQHPVFIDGNVPLGNQFFAYANAQDNGVQAIHQMPDGTAMAGDMILGAPQVAVPFAHMSEDGAEALAHIHMMSGPEVMAALASGAPDHSLEEMAAEMEDEPMVEPLV